MEYIVKAFLSSTGVIRNNNISIEVDNENISIEVDNEIIEGESESAKTFKVGLSPSKKKFLNCFNESLSNMTKNAFYFILKALFILKIFPSDTDVLETSLGHLIKVTTSYDQTKRR